jgi:hypothetical protein
MGSEKGKEKEREKYEKEGWEGFERIDEAEEERRGIGE